MRCDLAFLSAQLGLNESVLSAVGLVLSKLPDGRWSAPSAIGTAGLSWGLIFGGEIVELLIILGSEGAVKVFHKPQVHTHTTYPNTYTHTPL